MKQKHQWQNHYAIPVLDIKIEIYVKGEENVEQSLQPDLSFVTVFASHSAIGIASFIHSKTRANPLRVATQRTLGHGLRRLSVCYTHPTGWGRCGQ